MIQRSILSMVLVVLVAIATSGCGDESKDIFLGDCGNGVLDGGEECDDGNLLDDDACLSTCEFARCGDGFLENDVEQCDGSNLAGQSCGTLGLGAGTLRCASSCTFDTSGCGTGATSTPTPVVQETPTPTAGGGETPTPGGDTPTATPTPGGGATCNQGDMVQATITLSYDQVSSPDVSGVTVTLDYPGSALNIPGSGGDSSVQARVTDLTGVSGNLLRVSDQDQNADQVDDRLVVGIVNISDAIPPGPFVRVDFDCRAGTAPPGTSSFTCTPDVSNLSGSSVPATCSVSLIGP